jgi:hypothetical protein
MTDVFAIAGMPGDPRRRTQLTLQVTTLLGLYQAELARILGLHCPQIGCLASGREQLVPATFAWRQAGLLLRGYQALYRLTGGDGVAMRHWLRVRQVALDGTPHLLMIDEGRLAEVVVHLERLAARLP